MIESRLVPIAEIHNKGVWHYQPYSQEIVNVLAQIEQSPYPKVKLGDLIQVGTMARGFSLRPSENEGILYITIRNITENGLSLEEAQFISLDEHQKLNRTQLQRNDVVLSLFLRSDAAALYDDDRPANISSNLVRLRLNEKIEPTYLVYFLNSGIGQTLMHMVASGSAQPVLSLSTLVELPIILPPLSEQKKLITKIQYEKAEAERLAREAEKRRKQAQNSFFNELIEGNTE